jgi:hypothetical protein
VGPFVVDGIRRPWFAGVVSARRQALFNNQAPAQEREKHSIEAWP